MHKPMAKCTAAWGRSTLKVCVPVLGVTMQCLQRAIWSPLPCRGPCEVLPAWPLWSPVATEGLLHSTFSPGSRPQKRKSGLLKWRGCSQAIYRALYRSSATHDIPYENQCVWCLWYSVYERWGPRGSGRVSVRGYVNASAFMKKCCPYIYVFRHVWCVLTYKRFTKTHYIDFDYNLPPIK